MNLGLHLSLLDKVIRKYPNVQDFTVEDEEFLSLLKLVANHRKGPEETKDECYDRLKADAKTFERIYHQRGGKLTYELQYL